MPPFLAQYFDFDAERQRLTRKYRPPGGFRRVAYQYRYYRWRFPGGVLFFQVGRFCEFYHPQDAELARRLNLAPLKPNPRRALWGFPAEQSRRRFRFLLEQGQSVVWIGPTGRYLTVVWIGPTGRYLTGIEERWPVCRMGGLEKTPSSPPLSCLAGEGCFCAGTKPSPRQSRIGCAVRG